MKKQLFFVTILLIMSLLICLSACNINTGSASSQSQNADFFSIDTDSENCSITCDTIENDGSVWSVKRGVYATFTVTPDDGYYISDITVDSLPIAVTGFNGDSQSYTFKGVSRGHSISAKCAVKSAEFTVTNGGMASFIGQKSTTSVAIPEKVNGIEVASVDKDSLSALSQLTAIDVDEHQSHLASSDGALYDNSLSTLISVPAAKESIIFPSTLTVIGEKAFENSAIDEVVIPSTVTTVASNAFKNSSVSTLTIASGTTTFSENALADMTDLTEITLSDDLPDGYSLPVLTVGGASQVWTLEETTVQSMRSAGTYSALTPVTVNEYVYYQYPDGNFISEVPSDNGNSINIPASLNGASIKGLRKAPNSAQYECIRNVNEYKNVTFDNGIQIIGPYSFYNCDKMTGLTLPSSLTRIEKGAFFSCEGLSSIVLNNGLTYIGEQGYAYCTNADSITFPNSNLVLGSSVFDSCDDLTSVTIPANIAELPVGAFRKCALLNSVTVEGNTIIDSGAFSDCPVLNSLTLNGNNGNCDLDAFIRCPALTALNIGIGTTSIDPLLVSAFRNLSTISVNGSNPNFSSVGNVLYNKNQTRLIAVPFSVTSLTIPGTVSIIGEYACKERRLTSVTIPTSVTTVEEEAFSTCGSLNNVTFGAGSRLTEIKRNAFSFCVSLTSITLPSNIVTLGATVFCTSLNTLTLEGNVTRVGYQCFLNTSISTLNIGATVNKFVPQPPVTVFNWPPAVFQQIGNRVSVVNLNGNANYVITTVNGVYGLYQKDDEGNASGSCFVEILAV